MSLPHRHGSGSCSPAPPRATQVGAGGPGRGGKSLREGQGWRLPGPGASETKNPARQSERIKPVGSWLTRKVSA